MKGETLYWSLAYALNVLVGGGELMNPDGLPKEYPVVFISNHAAALGPIAATASLPLRVYPWVISDMMDFQKAPDYLRRDFIEPRLHVSPRISLRVATLVSKASVRLLRRVESIPVWQGERLVETYRLSLEYLIKGRSLLIFPEDPKLPMHELYRMTPFYRGFARLGEMYYRETGRFLRYIPLAVHPDARKVKIGNPVAYNPNNDPLRERTRIRDVLESNIHDLYLSVTLDGYAGVPLPH
jgi:hypothetical protein